MRTFLFPAGGNMENPNYTNGHTAHAIFINLRLAPIKLELDTDTFAKYF